MGMFAVKNDKGEWLGWEFYQDDPEFICGGGSVWTDLDKAKFYAKANGGHVVELVEDQAKIVVSEDEAEMLKKAKDVTAWRPAAVISKYAYNAEKDSDQEALLEDRLMRAYVNGWVVEKPKRFNVKVPHTSEDFYRKLDGKELDTVHGCINNVNHTFTDAEIIKYGLQDCEKVEVPEC